MDLDLEYKELANVPVNVDEPTDQGSAPDSACTTTHEVRRIIYCEFVYPSFKHRRFCSSYVDNYMHHIDLI